MKRPTGILAAVWVLMLLVTVAAQHFAKFWWVYGGLFGLGLMGFSIYWGGIHGKP